MSTINNPQIKFQPDTLSRRRAENIAKFHSLGYNDVASANELAKLVFTQFSLVKPDQLFLALAALKPHQVTNPFSLDGFGPKKTKETPARS